MDFNIVLGSLSNKSLKLELIRVLRTLTDMYSEGSININKIRFYCFELRSKDIKKWVLLTLDINDINDLTTINKKDLIHALNASHSVIIQKSSEIISLDDTVYLEVIN